ncbi:MAG: FAD-dependent oxidoreductase, partial [Aggregatilineales bacterium]
MNILILEREGRPGGRIFTRQQGGIHYDMGAVFGYPADNLAFPVTSSEHIQAAPHIGIHIGDSVQYGTTVMDCLHTLLSDDTDKNLLSEFAAQTRSADALPERLYAYLNAFFQVIHPGDLRDYMSSRQLDALQTFDTSHYKNGNHELIQPLLDALAGKIRLNNEVRHIQQQSDRVQIRVQSGEKTAPYFAKQVIISTPAPIAHSLLSDIRIDETTANYLQSWQYAGGTVVMLALQGAKLDDFSYLVTPYMPISTIIQQHIPDSDTIKLLIYYAGTKHDAVQSLTDDALIQQTIETLQTLSIGDITQQHIRFYDLQRWQRVGAIISIQNADLWTPAMKQVTSGIWLSGDYTLNPNAAIPFGMMPALSAGYQ